MADPILFLDADRVRFDSPDKTHCLRRYTTSDTLPKEELNIEYGGLDWRSVTPPAIIASEIFRRGYVVARVLNNGCYVDDGGGGADYLFETMDRCRRDNIFGEISELLLPFSAGSFGGDSTEYRVFKFKKKDGFNPVYMQFFPYATGLTLNASLKAPPVRRVAQKGPSLFLLGHTVGDVEQRNAVLVDSNNNIVPRYTSGATDGTCTTGDDLLTTAFEMLGKSVRAFGQMERMDSGISGALSGIMFEKERSWCFPPSLSKPDKETGKISLHPGQSVNMNIIPVDEKKVLVALGECEGLFEPNFEIQTIGFGYPQYAPRSKT